MRQIIATFALGLTLGLTLGMWTGPLMVELDDGDIVWRWLSPPTIKFNHDVINEALEPLVKDDLEEEEPDANWLNTAAPKWRPA